MKYIALIRHAPTAGNEIGAYIGRTDQPLSAAGGYVGLWGGERKGEGHPG